MQVRVEEIGTSTHGAGFIALLLCLGPRFRSGCKGFCFLAQSQLPISLTLSNLEEDKFRKPLLEKVFFFQRSLNSRWTSARDASNGFFQADC